MGGRDETPILMLAPPLVAPLQAHAMPLSLAALAAGLMAGAMIWFAASQETPAAAPLVPTTFADLATGAVMPIDPANAGAVAAAIATLRLPAAQRAEIERAIAGRQRRIAWIVLTDSMDPDGDTVAVESGGIVQHVVLNKSWVPVAVPLADAPIGITAVRDGGGGGITVALATRTGAMAVRIMLPGERIEVAP